MRDSYYFPSKSITSPCSVVACINDIPIEKNAILKKILTLLDVVHKHLRLFTFNAYSLEKMVCGPKKYYFYSIYNKTTIPRYTFSFQKKNYIIFKNFRQ